MPRRKPNYPPIGSISSGTMQPEDLLPIFADYCREFGGRAGKKLAREWDNLTEETMDYDERAEYILEEMFDLLDSVSPPYVRFGGHDGDGADYGWWPSWDSLEESARFGEVLKVADTSEIPVDYRGEVMHVNDHGNVTLYVKSARKLTEIWSCV